MQGQTVPPNVLDVSVNARTENELTLQWDKVEGNYNYTLAREGASEEQITEKENVIVTYTVEHLNSGTNYSFTLYTVSGMNRSTGYNFSNVTGK